MRKRERGRLQRRACASVLKRRVRLKKKTILERRIVYIREISKLTQNLGEEMGKGGICRPRNRNA